MEHWHCCCSVSTNYYSPPPLDKNIEIICFVLLFICVLFRTSIELKESREVSLHFKRITWYYKRKIWREIFDKCFKTSKYMYIVVSRLCWRHIKNKVPRQSQKVSFHDLLVPSWHLSQVILKQRRVINCHVISDGQSRMSTWPCTYVQRSLTIRDHVTANYSSLLQYHLRKMPRWRRKLMKAKLVTLPWYLVLNML